MFSRLPACVLAAIFALALPRTAAKADESGCPLLSCLTGTCFDNSEEEKPEEPKCNYGPCDCQPRKTLLQWSYGTSFSGGPPGMDEPLQSDRPGFTVSPNTVGRGVVQLEAGYMYTLDHNGNLTHTEHDFPQAEWRIGMFAEWFEWEITYNYSIDQDSVRRPGGIMRHGTSGSDDLLLGIKLCLTPQEGILPNMGIIPQMAVPSGSPSLTAGEVLPGLVWAYEWEIKKWTIECLTSINRGRDDADQSFTQFAQAVNLSYEFNKKLGGYVEWFVTSPTGSRLVRTQHVSDGGFFYHVTNNLQLDIEAGVGLNGPAPDFLAGAGVVARF
jgi:hypothetical protein